MRFTALSIGSASERYFKSLRRTKAKSLATIEKEEWALAKWTHFLQNCKMGQINLGLIRDFAESRVEEGSSNRTVNLDVIALHNLFKWLRQGEENPAKVATDYWKPLKHTTPIRNLMPNGTLEKLCAEALRRAPDTGLPIYSSGQFVSDYLKLLAYTGCRKKAGLSAKWSNVNWESKQISFLTKFDKTVIVDFNPALESHLRDMWARRDASSDWLFPGTQEGKHVLHPHNLFSEIRMNVGLEDITLHDFRHQFISRAVMAGIDYLTIARWVGHADGGILIGSVYGHLNNQHLQAAAAKLTTI